jgi:hypothetical protein
MPVDATHPYYDEFSDAWARNGDVIPGEGKAGIYGAWIVDCVADASASWK